MVNRYVFAAKAIMYSLLLVCSEGDFAFAQAFGITEGTATSQLQILKEIAPFYYSVKPKTPHPDFESYSVMSTPETGVCKVNGFGSTLENDAFGTQSRDLFARISEQLSQNMELLNYMNS